MSISIDMLLWSLRRRWRNKKLARVEHDACSMFAGEESEKGSLYV